MKAANQSVTQKFWGVQAVVGTKKTLSFKHKDGRLYFCLNKGTGAVPPPALFLTKKDAQAAIDKNCKGRSKKDEMNALKKMFQNVIEVDYSVPVKLTMSVN